MLQRVISMRCLATKSFDIQFDVLGSAFDADVNNIVALPLFSDYIVIAHFRICSSLQSVGGCWRAHYVMICNDI